MLDGTHTYIIRFMAEYDVPQVGPWSSPEVQLGDGEGSPGTLWPHIVKVHTSEKISVPCCFDAPRINA